MRTVGRLTYTSPARYRIHSGKASDMNNGTAHYTALPYDQLMVFIEASAFTKHIYNYLFEEEYLLVEYRRKPAQDCHQAVAML